ncbi:hypothetical protein [Patulibacter americanus]|uniref:hypothetical protein n=1 Tax=Patulibacter americanus TaxID=588672 RepID=UPI0003B77559|nr:hypothetical protein [Patulibacter americanus]
MVVPRSALGLLLAGSTGLTLVGVGVTGLSALDPTLQQAAADVQRQQQHQRVVPDVAPDVPRTPAVDARPQLVDCPEDRTPATTPGKV